MNDTNHKDCNLFDAQNQLEYLTLEFLKNFNTETDNKNEIIDNVNSYCDELEKILSTEGYRPHYFFVHKMLDDNSTIRIPEAQIKCNKALDIIKNSSDKISIFSSQGNTDIQFKIKMYFTAIEYETHLKKDTHEFKAAKASIDSIKDLDTSINKIKENVDEVKKESQNLLGNAIAVLGIFIAIVTAIFGGEKIISEAKDEVDLLFAKIGSNSAMLMSIILIILIAFIIVNLIVLFSFILSRLIKRDIGILCRYYCFDSNIDPQDRISAFKNCTSCKNSCGFYEKIKYRYAYIFYVEIAIIASLMALVVIWSFKVSIYDNLIDYHSGNNSVTKYVFLFKLITGIAIIASITSLAIFVAYRFSLNKRIADFVRSKKDMKNSEVVTPQLIREYKEAYKRDRLQRLFHRSTSTKPQQTDTDETC